MPFTQQATFDARIGAQGANAIAQEIRDAFQRERERQQQGAYNDQIVGHGRGQGFVSDGDWNAYTSARSPEARAGIAAGIANNVAADQMRSINKLKLDAYRREGQPQPMIAPDGTVIAGRYYVPGSRSVIDTNPSRTQNPAVADSFVNLSRDLKARTGADLGEWQQATNKKEEGGDFVADFPKRSYIDETSGKTMSIGGTTRRIPMSTYQQFLGRVNAIDGGVGSAAPNPGVDPLIQARDALSRGAPREEVIKRLQAAGLDTSGL